MLGRSIDPKSMSAVVMLPFSLSIIPIEVAITRERRYAAKLFFSDVGAVSV